MGITEVMQPCVCFDHFFGDPRPFLVFTLDDGTMPDHRRETCVEADREFILPDKPSQAIG
jgi:hypothetical protein